MDGGNNDWSQNSGGQAPAADPGAQAPQDPAQGGWNPQPADPAAPAAPAETPTQEPAPVAPEQWNPEPAAPAQETPAPAGNWDQGGQPAPATDPSQTGGDQGTGQGQ